MGGWILRMCFLQCADCSKGRILFISVTRKIEDEKNSISLAKHITSTSGGRTCLVMEVVRLVHTESIAVRYWEVVSQEDGSLQGTAIPFRLL